jgi:TonB-linked SusC/RagA family outer membrane protein
MRLTLLLLTVACLVKGLRATAQTISLSVKNTSMQKVFTLIEKQADVSFFYRVEALKKANKVSVRVTNASLKKVLELCFENQPLFYEVIDKTIVVKERPVTSVEITPLPQQPTPPSAIKLNGRIVTTTGEPVEMATVTIKGTKKATHSNSEGNFSLNIENKNAILVVTSVAIEPVEVTVGNKTNLTIVANSNVSSLDPVQMIGYGQTTKRLNTGNVTTIKTEEIEKQPVINVLSALEGLVPGLVVIQNTGMPGGSYQVNLRGISSLQANSDPLFIINGVPYPAGTFSLNNGYKQGGNALNILNIGDIERVEVLKDADATAIYGSRGGNGVILITTKKGKPGQTTANVNMYSGMGKTTRSVKLLNLRQYLDMRMESLKNDGSPVGASDNSLNGVWDTTRSTNWQKELLGGTANTTNVQLSLSGGTTGSTGSSAFLVNGAYQRETTVMPTTGADQHYSLHFHYSNLSAKKNFKIELSGSYQAGVDDLPAIDFTEYLPLLVPHQPSSYLPNGNLNPDPSIPFNPDKKLLELYKMNTSNLVSNLKLSCTPLKGLELSTSLGYHVLSLNDFYGVPTTALEVGYPSLAKYGTNNLQTFIIEPQAFYQVNLKQKGKLSALIGGTYQETASSFHKLLAVGFNNDALLRDPAAATSIYTLAYSSSKYRYLGTFSRLSYNLDNKYLFNLTGRVDGTSRFGPGKQFRPFGAAGAAWIFSEEKPMKNLKWINLAKLRGSFGFIGNSNIADYAFLDTYIPSPTIGDYQGVQPIVPNRLYNPTSVGN